MSDKVIFKGQVYGNTVATKMTTVLEEPAPIDDDGTYIYVIDKGTDTETVEIAGGGRVTYGATVLDTIILNGIKMKKGITDIKTAFSQGKIKPTDLYTSFNLPMCFTQQPDTWTVNGTTWDGTYPVIGEDYSLVGVHSVGNYIYIVTMANDLPKNLSDKIYQQDGLIAQNVDLKSITLGSTTPSGGAAYNMPRVYSSMTAAGSDSRYLIIAGVYTYAGMLFSVEDVVRVDANTLWTQQKEGNTYKFKTIDVEGYAKVRPYMLGIKKRTGELPSFYISSQTLPTYTGSMNVINKDIVSHKENGTRKFYTWNATARTFVPFKLSDLSTASTLNYKGDVSQLTTSGTVSVVAFEETDTVQSIFTEMLGNRVTFYTDSSLFQYGDYQHSIVSYQDIQYIQFGSFFTYNGDSCPCYVEIYGENSSDFYHYTLLTSSYNEHPIYCPFKNNAEVNFALGVREDLQYITKEEYDEHVPNGGEANE